MIFRLFRRGPKPAAAALYGAIVAQSRHPAFYRDFGAPDTVDGRFDMIVLHLTLLVRRLVREGDEGRGLAQDVFDLFCRDMDGNLREMGVGDLAVPKRMRGMAEAFYGRRAAYEEALSAHEPDALAAALARNVLGRATHVGSGRPRQENPVSGEPGVAADDRARALAAYVRAAVHALNAQNGDALGRGLVAFPAVEASEAEV